MTNITENPEIEVEIAPEEEARPRSVVSATYKLRYAERAATVRPRHKGLPKRALARSCSDWLAQELAVRTLDDKAKLKVDAFEAILDANGVEHRHWNRTTRGWQGRLRMTGRLALQRVVAEEEALYLPDGTSVKPPASWLKKHQN